MKTFERMRSLFLSEVFMDVVLCRIVRSLILSFHVACSSGTATKFTEKRDARSELLFVGLNPLLFSCSRCGRRHL